MNADTIPVESIRERDIDMLLLEELIIDKNFGKWLVNQFNFPSLINVNGAWRSVTMASIGETDVVFSYSSDIGKVIILIENKISASFTKDQFERYLVRADKLKEEQQCDHSFCILVAPKKYCDKQKKFESLSYEKIQSWFDQFDSKRANFKSLILEIAIKKLRRGHTLSEFCANYWDYFLNSEMIFAYKPPNDSKANGQIQFYTKKISNFTVYHKFQIGEVKISIPKKFVSKEELHNFKSQSGLFFDELKTKYRFNFDVPIMNTSQEIDPLVLGGIFEKINENVNFIHQLILDAK